MLPSIGKWLIKPILIIIICGSVSNFSDTILNNRFYIQLFGLFFTSAAYSLVFKLETDLINIINIYTKTSFWISVIVILQFIFFTLGYRFGKIIIDSSFSGARFAGFSGEPYFLAISLIPTFYYYLVSFLFNNKMDGSNIFLKLLLITFAILLTKSTVGLLGMLMCLFYVLFTKFIKNIKKGLLILFLVFSSSLLLSKFISNNEGIKLRINETVNLLNNGMSKKTVINSSTFALYSNFSVAKKVFNEKPIFGGGFASHHINYDRYINSIISKESLKNYGIRFNRMDANSLFIRLISETGLVGLLSFFYFLYLYYIGNNGFGELKIINNSILIMMILRLIRTGNYFGNGMMFFMLLYYETKKKNKKICVG